VEKKKAPAKTVRALERLPQLIYAAMPSIRILILQKNKVGSSINSVNG